MIWYTPTDMDAQTIRRKYFDFMEKRGHKRIPRALLVPQDDPTTLFTGSGMQPLIPYLLGETHPDGVRLVNSQTALRAQDIDEVGDTSHTTFFEMLGNWSLGDYFKTEQIQYFSEFLFDEVGLDPAKVYVSCYIGNPKFNIEQDNEAVEAWKKEFEKRGINAKVVPIGSADKGAEVGMQGGRIFLYDGNENWWSRGGNEENTPVGEPCGPDSEVFYDFGEDLHDQTKWGEPHPASDSPRFMEIGNSVFMSYRRTPDGVEELPSKNIDFGGGLERIAAASINSHDVYKISLLWPIIEKLQELSGKSYEQHTNSMRIVADHLRGATFLVVDGVVPSNKEQGYVMRRLLRRAIRFAFELGIEQNFFEQVVPVIADLYQEDYPEVAERRQHVIDVLVREERIFRETLRKGLNEFQKLSKDGLSGKAIFMLHDTYGFPVELSLEEAFKQNIEPQKNWREEFDALMKEQRLRSQTAGKGVFKGGLADQSAETVKLHTATHLMYEALRRVLGDGVVQRGSNVNAERTRFDFSHPEKVTREQLDQVEKIVNEQIDKDLKVEWKEYPTDEAFKMGAKGAFGDKYGDKVKVYIMGEDGQKPYSIEICGGPHVDHTGQLAEGGKRFKVTKEEASSAGVRRIKAVLQ
jgi:alanyl-tRNA synthetase